MTKYPNLAAMGNWMSSWVQPNGAIHGFHNHSVWGDNPYRWGDNTSGHTTWASPLISGLAMLLERQMNDRGRELLRCLIAFQTTAFQENGEFAHIGFQVGEMLKLGLIHNVHPDVSLALAALHGREYLLPEELESIRTAILRNMEACQRYGNGRPSLEGTCNQDYARLWAKLLFQTAFGDNRWKDEIPQDLDFMIEHFHVTSVPDAESEGTLRGVGDPDSTEPAEYYGLMIAPLVLAYEIYGEPRFLKHAGALCRHIVRSAWTDGSGQTRFHRCWIRVGSTWRKIDTPMLIAGMGHTLYGIARYAEVAADEECREFVRRCDETYAHYQHPRGFFAAATGWLNEADVVPSTGWNGHDFNYLAYRFGVGGTAGTDAGEMESTGGAGAGSSSSSRENKNASANKAGSTGTGAGLDAEAAMGSEKETAPRTVSSGSFWDDFWAPYGKTSVLLGDTCFWIEKGDNWAIGDYFWLDTYKLYGRKDESFFGRDCPSWIDPAKGLPEHFAFPGGLPVFVKMADGIYLKAANADAAANLDIASVASLPYRGLLE